MTRQFSVRLPTEDFAADRHRRVLATLPQHFRITDTGPTDAELVTHGIPGEAPICVFDSPGDARFACWPPGRQVVPMLRLAPRLRAAGAEVATARFALLDVTATIAGSDRTSHATALLETAAAYRLLTGRRIEHVDIHRFRGGFAATLSAPKGPLCTLACAESYTASGSWRLWAVGAACRLNVEIENGGPARPPSIRRFDRNGTWEASPGYQSAERETWLEVHALLDDPDRRPVYGWSEFGEDRLLIARLMQREKPQVAALT